MGTGPIVSMVSCVGSRVLTDTGHMRWRILTGTGHMRGRVLGVDHPPGTVGSWRVDRGVGVGRVEVPWSLLGLRVEEVVIKQCVGVRGRGVVVG